MKIKNALKIVLCLSLLCTLVAGGCNSKQTRPPAKSAVKGNQIGNLESDFQLQNLDGQTVSLNDFLGKPVLLNFWATWCGPCQGEMPLLQQIYQTWSQKGLVVLEIDVQENATDVQKFMTDNKLTMPTLLDDGKVTELYGITVIPDTYFIDNDGVIRQIVRGAFPNKAAIEKQISKIMP